jgi:ABC-type cobalamin/Fe3+-siderophores transport system ATPase subunit
VTYNTTTPLVDGTNKELPVRAGTPLFIVGPNGAGKSGLMSAIYRQNSANAIRISAQRQTWMESNFVPFTPQDKVSNEETAKNQDTLSTARYKEWNAQLRSGLVISDLINADSALSRNVRIALTAGETAKAVKMAASLPPLDVISGLFAASGIPIKLTIEENSAIVASKRGGTPYSIAALSDGERAALLMAGTILTAKKDALILVDEPERHLHASIVLPLLIQLFSERQDCTFIVSTHELSLPVACKESRTVLIRDSQTISDDVSHWDFDILEPGADIDDATQEAILGSRRKILFIEGTPDSLDQPLYELLFPGISIFPKAACGDVERSVRSIRDSSSLVWVSAFGIVDQDQLTPEKKASLESVGVYPLSVYSVEALYYDRKIVCALAQRQCAVSGDIPDNLVAAAESALIAEVSTHADRLAARMAEQAVKDEISLQIPDWKKIQSGQTVAITVDAAKVYEAERNQLSSWIAAKDIDKILARYPVRDTGALGAIASALLFKSRQVYEAAARKIVSDDSEIKARLLSHFGNLPAHLN